MKIIKTQSKIIKTKIKEHRRFKKELLDLINRMPNKSHQWITKSDWSLPQNFSRPYLDLFYKEVIPSSMQKMQNHFKANDGLFLVVGFNNMKTIHTINGIVIQGQIGLMLIF